MNWGHTGLLEKLPEGADIRDAVVADAAMQLRERHTAKYAAASSVDSDTSLVLCHHLRFELAALAYFFTHLRILCAVSGPAILSTSFAIPPFSRTEHEIIDTAPYLNSSTSISPSAASSASVCSYTLAVYYSPGSIDCFAKTWPRLRRWLRPTLLYPMPSAQREPKMQDHSKHPNGLLRRVRL